MRNSSDCDDTDASLTTDCSSCDVDADGHEDEACGGDDCDDTDPSVSPGESETWYDGVDQDCDDSSDYDADGDGYDHDGYGGGDCDDTDADVNPAATEVPGNGTDEDCDGSDAYTYDYQEIYAIWDASCTGCHTGGGSSGNLRLDTSHALVVDTASDDVSSMDLVEPSDTDASYLWHKLQDTQASVGGGGSQMPLGSSLSSTDESAIQTWIEEGAPEGDHDGDGWSFDAECDDDDASVEPDGTAVGECATDAEATDSSGNTVNLYDYRGYVVLLDLSAGWCPTCQKMAPQLETLYGDYADEGFVVVTALYEDALYNEPDASDAASWASYYGLTHPVWADTTGELESLYYQGGRPSYVLFDRQMNIVFADAGTSYSTLETEVTSLL